MKDTSVLFIAYQEASNPLMMYSQGFPYIHGLSGRGADFFVLTYESRRSFPDSRDFVMSRSRPIKWYHLYFSAAPGFISLAIDILQGAFLTLAILIKGKIRIVHARGFIAAIICFLPAKLLGRKVFFDTRGLLADKYAGGGLVSGKGCIYKIMKSIESLLLKYCDFFTIETDRHSRLIDRWNPHLSSKKKVIPCCIDLDFFKPVKKPGIKDKIVLVYLGKTGTWHYTQQMFDFFKVFSSSAPGSTFLFLTQDNPEAIIKIADGMGFSSGIRVVSPRREEIPSLLSSADAGIFFINPDHGYNSSHIKFGEYLACGLPVVVNKGIGDTGSIIEKDNVGVINLGFSAAEYEKTSHGLISVISDGDELRSRCRLAAERYFSLKEGIDKYEEIYRRLAGS